MINKIKYIVKNLKTAQWVAIGILISPFISLRIHQAYKTALEINWKNVWPKIPVDGSITGGTAACLLIVAGLLWFIHKLEQ